MEATTGFEPVNSGFADRRLGPLGYVAGHMVPDTETEGLGTGDWGGMSRTRYGFVPLALA